MDGRLRTWVAAGIAAASVGVAAFVYVRGTRQRSDSLVEYRATVEASRREVGSARFVLLEESDDGILSVARALVRRDGESEIEATRRREAIIAAHRFIRARFSQEPGGGTDTRVREFARSMADAGRTIKQDLAYNTRLDAYYASVVGHPAPPGASDVELFTEIALAEDDRGGRRGVPTAIAIDPDAIGVSIGRYSLANPSWPDPGGRTAHCLGYTRATTTHRAMWNAPDRLEEQITRDGGADVAQVHFYLEFGPGDRRPALVNLVWSPVRAEWMVESTGVGSYSNDPDDWVRWAY